jgi:transposase
MKVEVLGTERRRRWGYEEKARIIEETAQPGVVVCDVARRHGISQGLLFTWRRLARQGRLGGDPGPRLVPVEIVPTPTPPPPTPPPSDEVAATLRTRRKLGVIEIDLGGGRRVRVDRDVDAEALRRVLDVLGRR